MTKKKLTYFAILVLALIHQDFWLWDDGTLLFGFLPIGLAYHVVLLAACGVCLVSGSEARLAR